MGAATNQQVTNSDKTLPDATTTTGGSTEPMETETITNTSTSSFDNHGTGSTGVVTPVVAGTSTTRSTEIMDPNNNNNKNKSALQDNIDRKGKNAYYFAHSHKATGPLWDGKAEPRLLSSTTSTTLSSTTQNSTTTTTTTMTNTGSVQQQQRPTSFDYTKSNITSYGFLDDGPKVKLYIDLENVGEQCTDNDLILEYTERSLSLTVLNYQAITTTGTTIPPPTKTTTTTTTTTTDDEKDDDEKDDKNQNTTLSLSSTSTKMTLSPPPCLCFARLSGPISSAFVKRKDHKLILTMVKIDPEFTWHTINDKGGGDSEIHTQSNELVVV